MAEGRLSPGPPGWEQREAEWFSPSPPPELVRFLGSSNVPPGPAVDIGCGVGVVASFLVERFRPVVGIDVDLRALSTARDRARAAVSPAYVAAAAPAVPLKDASVVFAFDRGCMQNLPRDQYAPYLLEVARILKPGGTFELLFLRGLPPTASARDLLNQLLRRARGTGPPLRLSRSRLERVVPPSLEIIFLEPVEFESPKTGRRIGFTHCVLRRAG